MAPRGPRNPRLTRVEAILADLPEWERVDIEAWGDEPTFRVRGKNFVFADPEFTGISVKLDKEEAAAVVATDPLVEPCGYGLGRHGWISFPLPAADPDTATDEERWAEITEWIRTSYVLRAPKTLARRVLADDERRTEQRES